MITADEFLNRLQRKLDDEEEEVWTRDFLLSAAQDGYDRLCRESECLFDMEMFDNQPLGGNHTRDFEVHFMPGVPILARFNFTRESEKEFVDDEAKGPVNHTRPSDATAITAPNKPTPRTLARLSNRYVSVDRVTHNWLRLEADHDRYFRLTKFNYETLQGGVWSYSMDQDGVFNLRTVGVPVAELPTVAISGIYGAMRQCTEIGFDSEPTIGEYGVIRSIPRHFAGNQYGGIKRVVSDDLSTRVEVFRLGKELTSHPFEIPDRAVRYVEWWAMYRAFSEPGHGENSELAAHFKQRFEYGLEVMKKRVNSMMRERTIALGSKRTGRRDSYLEMFPADYGYKRPFRG